MSQEKERETTNTNQPRPSECPIRAPESAEEPSPHESPEENVDSAQENQPDQPTCQRENQPGHLRKRQCHHGKPACQPGQPRSCHWENERTCQVENQQNYCRREIGWKKHCQGGSDKPEHICERKKRCGNDNECQLEKDQWQCQHRQRCCQLQTEGGCQVGDQQNNCQRRRGWKKRGHCSSANPELDCLRKRRCGNGNECQLGKDRRQCQHRQRCGQMQAEGGCQVDDYCQRRRGWKEHGSASLERGYQNKGKCGQEGQMAQGRHFEKCGRQDWLQRFVGHHGHGHHFGLHGHRGYKGRHGHGGHMGYFRHHGHGGHKGYFSHHGHFDHHEKLGGHGRHECLRHFEERGHHGKDGYHRGEDMRYHGRWAVMA